MAIGYEECQFTSALRSLVRFDLSSIPRDTQIVSATLHLYLESACSAPGYSYPVTIYPVTAGWSESGVTWFTQPTVGTAATSTNISVLPWGDRSFNITSLVQGWISGTMPNNGVELRSLEYSGNNTASLYFYTREYSDDNTRRPYLEIMYSSQAADEDSNGAPAMPSLDEIGHGERLRDHLHAVGVPSSNGDKVTPRSEDSRSPEDSRQTH